MTARFSFAIATALCPVDSLKLLRSDVALSVSQTGNCPLIGSAVELAGE